MQKEYVYVSCVAIVAIVAMFFMATNTPTQSTPFAIETLGAGSIPPSVVGDDAKGVGDAIGDLIKGYYRIVGPFKHRSEMIGWVNTIYATPIPPCKPDEEPEMEEGAYTCIKHLFDNVNNTQGNNNTSQNDTNTSS